MGRRHLEALEDVDVAELDGRVLRHRHLLVVEDVPAVVLLQVDLKRKTVRVFLPVTKIRLPDISLNAHFRISFRTCLCQDQGISACP